MTISEFVNKVGFKVKDEDVKKVNDSVKGIKDTATKLLGAIGIGFSLAAVNGLIEEFGAVNNAIRNSVGELDNMEEAQGFILDAANDCRSTYSDMANTVSNLVKSSSDLFPVEDAAEYTSVVTKLLKSAGRSQGTVASVMEGLNKSFQKGIVDTETLNKLLEQAPEAANVLANHLGVAKTQLLDMASNGRMKVEDLKLAFLNSANEINAAFGNVDMTISDGLTSIRNKWGLWLAQTDKTLGVTKTLSKVMVSTFNGVISILNRVRTAVVWLSEKLGGTDKLLKLVAITAGSIFVALNFTKIVDGIKNITKGVGGLNAKLFPIIAIIIIIALLVEDFINFIQGNQSLLGHLFDKMGINAEDVSKKITDTLQKLKQTLTAIWDEIKNVLSSIWDGISFVASSIWGGISDYFGEHGDETMKSLTDSWNSIKNSLSEIWESIKGSVEKSFGKINSFLEEHGTSIEDVFNKVGEAIGFLIDKAVRLTGKIAEIGFEVLSDAVKFCTDMFTGLVDIVCDAVDWFSEHKVLTDILAAAIGVLTTAIIAYNIAQAIKNAGGIAELIQLAGLAIGIGALTVAQTAHTVATTIATAATTAFGAAMAFLTSPITLVVAAIAAVIAIIILCIKYWDEIKAAASKAWDWIKSVWSSVAEWFSGIFKAAWEGIKNIWNSVVGWFQGVWNGIVGVFSAVGSWFAGIFRSAWDGIKNAFNAVGSFFQSIWDTITGMFSKIGTSIGNGISNAFKSVVNGVIGFASKIINGFIDSINWAIGIINKIPGVNIKQLSRIELQGLAQGGYIGANKPTPVVIGDNRTEGEIVSPISKMRDTMLDALRMFASAKRPSPTTQMMSNSTTNRSVVQNIEFHNEFNGDRAIQKEAKQTMDRSAEDITATLARGLAMAT